MMTQFDYGFTFFEILFISFSFFFLFFFLWIKTPKFNDGNFIKEVLSLIDSNITNVYDGVMEFAKWRMFLSIIFFYLFFTNIMYVLPFYFFSNTCHLGVSFFIGFCMWISIFFYKMFWMNNSFSASFTHLTLSIYMKNMPKSMTAWMYFTEMIGLIFQPITLSVRITMNIMIGHCIMYNFNVICSSFINFSSPTSSLIFLFLFCGLFCFEILVGAVQAAVFVIMLSFYVSHNIVQYYHGLYFPYNKAFI